MEENKTPIPEEPKVEGKKSRRVLLIIGIITLLLIFGILFFIAKFYSLL